MKHLLPFLILLVVGCGGDFSPTIHDMDSDTSEAMSGSTTLESSGASSGEVGESEESSSGSSSDGTTTMNDGMDESGSSGSSGESSTGGFPENPGPDEPCDPFLAFSGIAPCEDPNSLLVYTCTPVMLMSTPNETVWEFWCLGAKDHYEDGWDLGDPCGPLSDAPDAHQSCMNSFCLSNDDWDNQTGTMVNGNHPPGACPFVWEDVDGDPYDVGGCCTAYCDKSNPCETGWSCINVFAGLDVGVCVWE